MKHLINKTIPFVDLQLQYSLYRDDFEKAIQDVCCSGAFILGPEIQRFKKVFNGVWKDSKMWNGEEYDKDGNVINTFVDGKKK